MGTGGVNWSLPFLVPDYGFTVTHLASESECFWCGASPPCPRWQHKDPDEPDCGTAG